MVARENAFRRRPGGPACSQARPSPSSSAPASSRRAMGIVLTTAFALGLAIISIVKPTGIDLFHVLWATCWALRRRRAAHHYRCALVLGGGAALFRGLQSGARPGARKSPACRHLAALRLHAALGNGGVLDQAVGVLLVVAMLVTPAPPLAADAQLATMMATPHPRGAERRRRSMLLPLDVASGRRSCWWPAPSSCWPCFLRRAEACYGSAGRSAAPASRRSTTTC